MNIECVANESNVVSLRIGGIEILISYTTVVAARLQDGAAFKVKYSRTTSKHQHVYGYSDAVEVEQKELDRLIANALQDEALNSIDERLKGRDHGNQTRN